jgi:hypothetical protein
MRGANAKVLSGSSVPTAKGRGKNTKVNGVTPSTGDA